MKIEANTSGSAAVANRAEVEDLRAAMRTDMQVGGENGVGATGASGIGTVGEAEGGGFSAIFEKAAMEASAKDREASQKSEALADGRSDDLHGTMITMKEADISMKLVGTVRDKLMDAFHELWRINV